MPDSILAFNYQNSAGDKIQTAYTAPEGSNGVRVKSFTASNNTTTSHTYKAYIYNQAGVPVEPVIPQTIVVRDKSDNGAGIINQVIPAGGSLRVESSAALSLNFYVTGLEQ